MAPHRIDGTALEPVVWADIEGFLRDPGALLDALAGEMADSAESAAATAEAEHTTLEAAGRDLARQRDRLLDLYLGDRFDHAELDRRLDRIDDQEREIQARLAALHPRDGDGSEDDPQHLDDDLRAALHQRIDAGLDDAERQEIAALLITKITIHTTVEPTGKKRAKALVEYRFPAVVRTDAVRGSWRRSA